jgi:hypothetical protein
MTPDEQIIFAFALAALAAWSVIRYAPSIKALWSSGDESAPEEPPHIQSVAQMGGQTAHNIVNIGRNPDELLRIADAIARFAITLDSQFEKGRQVDASMSQGWWTETQAIIGLARDYIQREIGPRGVALLTNTSQGLPFNYNVDLGDAAVSKEHNGRMLTVDRVRGNLRQILQMLQS